MDELDRLVTRAFPPDGVYVTCHYQERGSLWIATLHLKDGRKTTGVVKGAYEDRKALGEALQKAYHQALAAA